MIELRQSADGITPEQLDGFFVGWPTPPDQPTHLRLLRSSYAVALAVDDGRVVGFANAVSDGVLSAHIPLLEVLPQWQGQGIGRRLIESLQQQLEHLYMIDIVCDPNLESFYAPLGFQPLLGMAKRNYDRQSGAPSEDQ